MLVHLRVSAFSKTRLPPELQPVLSCESLAVFLHFPLEEKGPWGPFYQLRWVLAKGRHLLQILLKALKVTPSIKFATTHLYTWVERESLKAKWHSQGHNMLWFEDKCTDHKVTVPVLCASRKICSEFTKAFHLHDEAPVHRILWSSLLHSMPLRLRLHWQ